MQEIRAAPASWLAIVGLATACSPAEAPAIDYLCNRDTDCPAYMRCETGRCVEVADAECSLAEQCVTPGPCEESADVRCIAGRCRYPTRLCQEQHANACEDSDSVFVSYPTTGVCDTGTDTCTYIATRTPCPSCTATCLASCAGMRCDDVEGGCRQNGTCVPGTPASCEYATLPDGSACSLPEDQPPVMSGSCASGTCVPASGCANDPDCQGTLSGGECVDGTCHCPAGTPRACDGTCIGADTCCANAECGADGVCNASHVCECAGGSSDCGGDCCSDNTEWCCDHTSPTCATSRACRPECRGDLQIASNGGPAGTTATCSLYPCTVTYTATGCPSTPVSITADYSVNGGTSTPQTTDTGSSTDGSGTYVQVFSSPPAAPTRYDNLHLHRTAAPAGAWTAAVTLILLPDRDPAVFEGVSCGTGMPPADFSRPGVDCRGFTITELGDVYLAQGESSAAVALRGSSGHALAPVSWSVDGANAGTGFSGTTTLASGSHTIAARSAADASGSTCCWTHTVTVVPGSQACTPAAREIQARFLGVDAPDVYGSGGTVVSATSVIAGRDAYFAVDNSSSLTGLSIDYEDGTAATPSLTHAFATSGTRNVRFSARDATCGVPLASRIQVEVLPDHVTVSVLDYLFPETVGFMECTPYQPSIFQYRDSSNQPQTKSIQACMDGGRDASGAYVITNTITTTAIDAFVRDPGNSRFILNVVHDNMWPGQCLPPTCSPPQWTAPAESWRCCAPPNGTCSDLGLAWGIQNYPDVGVDLPVHLENEEGLAYSVPPGLSTPAWWGWYAGITVDPFNLTVGQRLWDLYYFDPRTELQGSLFGRYQVHAQTAGSLTVLDGKDFGGSLGFQSRVLVMDGGEAAYLERNYDVSHWGRAWAYGLWDTDCSTCAAGHGWDYSSCTTECNNVYDSLSGAVWFNTKVPADPDATLPIKLDDVYTQLYADPADPRNFLADKYVGADNLDRAPILAADKACDMNQPKQPASATALSYYTVDPCRLVDTRNPDSRYAADWSQPIGGPAVAAGTWRDFYVFGRCGLHRGAKAVDVNITTLNATGAGSLSFAEDCRRHAEGPTSGARLVPGRAMGFHTMVRLDTYGYGRLRMLAEAAGADVIVDVFGYYL